MSSLRLALKQSLQETGHLAPKEKKKRKNQKQNQQQQQQQQSRPLKPPRRKRLPGDPPRKRGRPPKHPRPEPEQQDEEEEEDNNNDNGNNNEKQHNHKDNNNKDNDSEEEEESTENEFSYDSESNDEDDEEESDEESHNSSEEEVDEENEDDVADAATATRPSVPSHDDDDEEEEEHETEEEEDQDVRDRRKQLKLQKKLLARKQLHNDATTTTATGIGDEEEEDHQRQRKQQRQKKLKQRKELKQHSAAHTIQSQWKRKKEHGQTTTTSGTPHHSTEQQSQQSSKAPSAAGAPRTASPVPTTKQPALHNKRVKSPPPNENTTAAATSHDNNHNHDTKKKKRNKHRDDKESSNNNNKDSSSPSKSRTVPPPTLEILDWASTLSQRKSRKHMTSGLRVKVRFATKVKRDGKVIKKKKWYGGRVSAVSKEGSKIRIKYDDGTSEISKFPDKDVVVDEQGNGQHLVSGEKFVPPPSPVVAPTVEEKEEEEAVSDDNEDEEDQEAEMVMEEPPQPASSIVEATTSTTSETKQLPSSSSKEEEKDEKPKSISPISKPPTVSKATTATTTMSSESHTIAPEKEPIPVIVLEKSSPTAAAAAVVAVVDTPVADQDQKATKDVKPPVEQLPPVPNIVLEEQQKAPTIAPVSSHAPMLFGSPTEEGELSPGLTYSKDSKIPSKPVDLGTLESVPGFEKETETSSPESDGVGVVVPAAPAATSTVTAVESESSVPKEDSKEKVKEAPPRPSFKIRISQVKADRHDSKKTQAILDAAAHNESSEEEIFEATPANQRGRRPGEHGEDKIKRKRSSNDLSDTAPPSKRRIHLKKHQVDTNNTPDQSHDATETAAGESQEEPSGVAAAGGEEPLTSEQGEGLSEHKEKPKISVTIRRPQSTTEMEDETIPLAPPASAPGKKRKLGERSSSPKIRIRSPGAQSPTPVVARTESPAPMSGERVETKALSKPAVTVSAGIDVGTAEAQPSSGTKIHLVLTGSKNSAFERKQPKAAKEGKNTGDGELSEPALEEGEEDAAPFVGKSKLRRSKNSTESLPAVRSGRRAAQQAKDRIKSKDGEPSDMEPGTKKKKKRKMDGNDSENSEDDRQWVQCDNCGKWRILPSTVKLSSLPKHWYCDMNIYDPKRMSCTAAEQTPKQVAKDYKRAKKRARQRLEQEQSAMEAIPEEGEAKDVRAEKTPPHVAPSSPLAADDVSPREQTVTAKESSKKNKRVSPAAAAEENDPAVPSDSGSDNKGDKKASVGKNVKSQDAVDAVEPAPAVLEAAVEPKAKPGRRRGRPARDPNKDSDSRTSSTDKPGDGENVEWVQCEKCDKWRKLPHHITADELPDVWYCTMNTWNPNSASCETDEDIADALHQDVSSGNAIPGNPGKFSYRSLIFGTGRKHNRPMSERSRAGESLFQRPFDEIDNPYPTVMYSKSSAFLARTSNFNKASTVDEKTTSVFDVMSNSELWVELRGAAQPLNVISGGNYGQQKECYRYDNLPGDMKNSWRELVLYALGLGTLTGDEVLLEAQDRQWEDMPTEWLEMRSNCTEDIVVNTLLQLVRDGQVEMTCSREPHLPIEQWVPKYRKVRRRREADEAVTASRCMKISKPWKQREESNSDWISGRTAFA